MKKFLASILALATVLSVVVSPALAVPPPPDMVMYHSENGTTEVFVDCADNVSVLEAKILGIVNGGSDNNFRPYDTLTRAEFAQMVYNAFGSDDVMVAPPRVTSINGGSIIIHDLEWWQNAEWYLFHSAIWPWFDSTEQTFYSDICLAYYDGDINHEFAPNASASYEWIVTTLYLIWAANGNLEIDANFAETALAWAAERECGPNDFWRHVSSGRFITRAESCELLLQLCELT